MSLESLYPLNWKELIGRSVLSCQPLQELDAPNKTLKHIWECNNFNPVEPEKVAPLIKVHSWIGKNGKSINWSKMVVLLCKTSPCHFCKHNWILTKKEKSHYVQSCYWVNVWWGIVCKDSYEVSCLPIDPVVICPSPTTDSIFPRRERILRIIQCGHIKRKGKDTSC